MDVYIYTNIKYLKNNYIYEKNTCIHKEYVNIRIKDIYEYMRLSTTYDKMYKTNQYSFSHIDVVFKTQMNKIIHKTLIYYYHYNEKDSIQEITVPEDTREMYIILYLDKARYDIMNWIYEYIKHIKYENIWFNFGSYNYKGNIYQQIPEYIIRDIHNPITIYLVDEAFNKNYHYKQIYDYYNFKSYNDKYECIRKYTYKHITLYVIGCNTYSKIFSKECNSLIPNYPELPTNIKLYNWNDIITF